MPKGQAINGLPVKSYIFSAVSFNPPVSHLYSYEFASGKLSEILSAQSSDPLLYLDDTGELFLFNRTATNSNIVRFIQEDGQYKKKSSHAIPYVLGAPYSVVRLDQNTIIMSYYGSGEIVTYSLKENYVLATHKINTAPRSFKPQKLLLTEKNLYVVSHGINDRYEPDDSQGVYVFKREKSEIQFAAYDFYPLHATFPQLVRQNDNELLFVGLCYSMSDSRCKQSMDLFSLVDTKVTQMRDLRTFPYKANGGYTKGLNGNEFMISGLHDDQSKAIINVAEKTGEATPVFNFSKNEAGCYLLDSLPEHKILMVGSESDDGQAGKLIIQVGETKTTLNLPLIPYQGVFIRE